MFSAGHLIWIAVSAALVAAGLFVCAKKRPDPDKVIRWCFCFALLSEAVKIFSVMQIVPMVDPVISGGTLQYLPSGEYTPAMGAEHLPFELCSLQILFLGICCVLKDEKKKHAMYALIYPTGSIGGLMGILLASITAYYETAGEYFRSPRAWQFFLFHSMIVCVSLYIGISSRAGLRFRDWKKAVLGVLILDLPTFYLNALLSEKVYVHDELIGVTHRINFFSSYVNPLGLVLTEKWQWFVYLAVRAAVATGLIILFFLPLLGRDRRQGGGNETEN